MCIGMSGCLQAIFNRSVKATLRVTILNGDFLMPSRMRFLVGILSLTIFNWLLAGAQNGAQNDYLDRVGIPDFTVADPVESGFINLANGGLHLEIPMAQLAQRGKAPFSIKLVYDS